jgi:fructokinase
MKRPPVIVGLGEVLWDVFPDGVRFGGAPANFACHAASLGAAAFIVSAVGNDADGESARSFLMQHGVNCAALGMDAAHPTGRVLVSLDEAGHASYQIMEGAAWDHLAWSAEMQALAERTDAVCFGTLGQRCPSARQTIQRFLGVMPQDSLRLLDVNLRQDYFSEEILRTSLELATAVKLNEDELPVLTALLKLQGEDESALLADLAQSYELALAVFTQGASGAMLYANGVYDSFTPPSVRVVDTVGAGDSFTAAVVTGFLAGLPLAEINRHAAAVAGFVCSHRGATPALPSALRRPIALSPLTY